jgi:hypothetical protein
MSTPFTLFSGTDYSVLASSLLAPNSGIFVSNILLAPSGGDAVNLYDGSLTTLGIGAGLLLTTGTMPGLTNSVDWFGQDNSATSGLLYNGDAEIDAVVNAVFQTQSYDATTLSFDFTVSDTQATSVSFDLVFGSDEYPEWVDQFVDCAIVTVNGVNYALFNHDPMHPLSVVSSNLAAGYFQDNADDLITGVSPVPIEYDGVSHVLKIVAPIITGGATNHIKIGIADTGDHIYDSGMFIANFAAGTIPGSGVVTTTTGDCTESSDVVTGSTQDEYFNLKAGDDTLYAGAGDDIIVAGQGNDVVYGGSGNDEIMGGGGDDCLDGGDGIADTAVYAGASNAYNVASVTPDNSFVITDSVTGSSSEGKDTLKNVEQVKFSDGLFALGAAGLSLVSDPGVIPPPSNMPGIVVVSGIGSAGHTLTATVSDPDGIDGDNITYQWQRSTDDGASWAVIADATDKKYLLLDGDVGHLIQVVANYTDNGAQPETPVSFPKAILPAQEGDALITLIHLDAPSGSIIINPLTTLLKDALELGISPNIASQAIKTVLGIPSDVQLQSYDAYEVLLANPHDAVALAVEKVAVQIAILTSLSDDDTGMNLTLAILDAASANKTYDLGELSDICAILGFDPSGNLPESVNIIVDRNSSITSDLNDGGDVAAIEKEWVDFCSNQDDVASTSIADLSIHLNQSPQGSATFVLPEAVQNQDYLITSSDLLQGFTDPDGDALSVAILTADAGSVQDNADGTWLFTPAAGYAGPVELTYTVSDGQGGIIEASQMLVVADVNPPAVTTFTPADAAMSVPVGSDMVFTFNENIHFGSGNIAVHFRSPLGDVVESYDVASSANLAISGNTLTINPANDLAPDTHYFVILDEGSVEDLSGNVFAGTTAYDFMTAALPPVEHNLSGNVTFWKTGEAISDVTTTLSSFTLLSGGERVWFNNLQHHADGSSSVELWESTVSLQTDIQSLQLELLLPENSTVVWQQGDGLPDSWTVVMNNDISGRTVLAGVGLDALAPEPVQLGVLKFSAPSALNSFELAVVSGWMGGSGIIPASIACSRSDENGHYIFTDIRESSYMVSADKESSSSTGNAVTAADALAALKIAVGLNPNVDGVAVSPCQYLAADVNHDGKIRSTDALNILKMAVGLESAPEDEWIFVPESVGSETMSRNHVDWSAAAVALDLYENLELDLVGIVKGDADGSWVGE